MKVLIVSTVDIEGGAARAAYRFHQALLAEGIDSQMLVQSKLSDDYTVIGPQTKFQKVMSAIRPIFDSIPVRFYRNRTKTLFSPSWLPSKGLVDKINELNPDIVHFHWVAGGMIRIEEMAKIKAPIVWNMQDMWAFTGGCHYDEECEGYVQDCAQCKVLHARGFNNLAKHVLKRKIKTFAQKNIYPVGVSHWIYECSKRSKVFASKDNSMIHNCLDTHLFDKMDQKKIRKLFKIPLDKKVILFGAMNVLGDPRKGGG